MSKIKLRNVCKQYPGSNDYSVENFNLDIHDKEFIVLVGPSGCGKSTSLRMIAGLENISEGDLLIDGKRANEVEPKNRGISMVFQNYALYPHMTVFENMAFGLRRQKVPKDQVKAKVEEAAEILELTGLLKRKPKELSGGQRQRVALGRAIVRDSGIFLMDEPLSNLDAKLRVHMRAEIIRLHRQLGKTTIYVTHDQTEAMTMATRIVIMKDGRIQQIGTPSEVYRTPENVFVAGFIGQPGMNLLNGRVQGNRFIFGLGEAVYQLSKSEETLMKQNHGDGVILGIRPEDITISARETTLKGSIELIERNGAEMLVHTRLANQQIVIKCKTDDHLQSGDKVYLGFNENAIHIFDKSSEKRLKSIDVHREELLTSC